MFISTSMWQGADQQAAPATSASQVADQATGTTADQTAGTPVVVDQEGVAVMTGVPQTASQVQALRARRSELSNQLISATNRRDELVRELEDLPANLRPGVEQRIELLDARILGIEGEIATTGSQLAASTAIPGASLGPFDSDGGGSQGFVVVILLILFVAFPLTLAWAKRMLRKPLPPPAESRLLTESAARLERLEHAVDAIAIEVERVSEGQRFMTRVLDMNSGQLSAAAGDMPSDR